MIFFYWHFSKNPMSQLFKQSSDVSCHNMTKLAKKYEKENTTRFDNTVMCSPYYTTPYQDYVLFPQLITHKHCEYKRDPYNTPWMDELHNKPVIDGFNINTSARFRCPNNQGIQKCSPSSVIDLPSNGVFAAFEC